MIECNFTKQLWSQLEIAFKNYTGKDIKLGKKEILFNNFEKNQCHLNTIMKTVLDLKQAILNLKFKIETLKTWDNKEFQHLVLEIINTRLK